VNAALYVKELYHLYREEPETRSDLKVFGFFAFIAVAIPVCALFLPVRPPGESLGDWFQRSGSVMTVLCLVLDLKVFALYGRLFPSGFVDKGFDEFKAKYLPIYKGLTILLLSLTAVGTVIWGYGDLLVPI
jgi:hypothetical protein